MNTQKIFIYIKVLSSIGILLAVYLLWQQMYQPAFRPCTINATINCDAIITGGVSKTLGIPTPIFGLVGYVIILIASIVQNRKLLLMMSSFGLLFCLWIAYRELFELRVLCPICILCQLIMITIFYLVVKLNIKGDSHSE